LRSRLRLLVVDIKMPKVDGLEVLRQAHERDPDVVCIVITGYATLELAVESTKLGAYDFLAKPFTRASCWRRSARLWRCVGWRSSRAGYCRAGPQPPEIATEKSRLRTIIDCMQDGVLVTNRMARSSWSTRPQSVCSTVSVYPPRRRTRKRSPPKGSARASPRRSARSTIAGACSHGS